MYGSHHGFFRDCNGCIIENNYIDGAINNLVYSSFRNNYFSIAAPDTGSNTYIGNSFEQVAGDIFTTDEFLHPKHLTIKEGSPCKNAGVDGTDIGIYGGGTPFKAGSIPYNPHVRKANISTQTIDNGMLKVDITVSAQER